MAPPQIPTLPFNFGGISRDKCRWDDCRVAFLSVPYDLTCSYGSGTRRGPLAILEASTHMELFDEELRTEPSRLGFHTLDPLEALASGPEEMVRHIRDYVRPVIEADKFPVLLGGEHTVTLGIAGSLKEKYPGLSFLQLDAHADLREEFEGTRFSHACVGRRLAEIAPLAQVGIRSLSPEEYAFWKNSKIHTLFWHELVDIPDWPENRIPNLTDEVYITIDLDVLDPGIMPSVGTPEPGGLQWRELTRFLRRVSRRHKIVGFVVVELSPIPGLVGPDFLAAKLVYRLLGYIFADSLPTE